MIMNNINTNKCVDLHVHSTRSDGTYTPSQLVDYAIEKGLKAFALTDHDTVDGIEEALEAAEGKSIEVIPGIEYSTEYRKRDVHIVGLFIDYKAPVFLEYLKRFQDSRIERNHKLCRNLQGAGFDITYDPLRYIVSAAYDHVLFIGDKQVSLRETCGENTRIVFEVAPLFKILTKGMM